MLRILRIVLGSAAGAMLVAALTKISVTNLRAMYKSRRDVMAEGLIDAGWDNIVVPDASMFLWAPLPEKYKSIGCLEFSKLLLKHADVAVAPGIGFGPGGEGFVRIALVENKNRIRQATKNIKRFLAADAEKQIHELEKTA